MASRKPPLDLCVTLEFVCHQWITSHERTTLYDAEHQRSALLVGRRTLSNLSLHSTFVRFGRRQEKGPSGLSARCCYVLPLLRHEAQSRRWGRWLAAIDPGKNHSAFSDSTARHPIFSCKVEWDRHFLSSTMLRAYQYIAFYIRIVTLQSRLKPLWMSRYGAIMYRIVRPQDFDRSSNASGPERYLISRQIDTSRVLSWL